MNTTYHIIVSGSLGVMAATKDQLRVNSKSYNDVNNTNYRTALSIERIPPPRPLMSQIFLLWNRRRVTYASADAEYGGASI